MESLEMGEQLFANRDYPVYFIQIFGTALTYFILATDRIWSSQQMTQSMDGNPLKLLADFDVVPWFKFYQ